MSADDATLIVTGEGKDTPAPPLVQSQQSLLYAEARRLLDFKRQHITRQNQTPCPECAVPVSVQARKCPHCGSEIAEYTDAARQALGELNALTREIAELHSRELSRYAEGIRARSLRERAALFFADPQVQRDLRILLPAALLLFVVLVLVRVSASGLVFWLVAPLAGSLAWVTLRRSGVNHYVAVDLYRTLLAAGLGVLLCSALFAPRGFWPTSLTPTVSVKVQGANLRQQATADSKVVGSAARGERLHVVDRSGSWFRVRTDEGETGWIYADLVE